MAMKDRFLQEARIGTLVELMVGQKELHGTVVSLDAESVKIRKENGKTSAIALDSIAFYEFDDSDDESESIINDPVLRVPSPNTPFDFTALESRGLVFTTCFWNENIDNVSLSPAIKEKCKEVDPNNNLLNLLNTTVSKLNYCVKIQEFDLKFGRIQRITSDMDRLCITYNQDFLFELLAIILINSGATYKESLKKISTNRVTRLGDAVVCFKKKRFEEMAYYLSEFYSNVKLTEQNFDNFQK